MTQFEEGSSAAATIARDEQAEACRLLPKVYPGGEILTGTDRSRSLSRSNLTTD
jgi:hypothetical protein